MLMVSNEEKAKYIIKTFNKPNWITVALLRSVSTLLYTTY